MQIFLEHLSVQHEGDSRVAVLHCQPVSYTHRDVYKRQTIIRVTIDEDTVEGGEAHMEYGAVRKRYKSQTSLS